MTIKQQLIPLRIGKGLLSLVALFVMLLAPQRAWAQDNYGLTVAGVSVTSENAAAIAGDNIEGTVYYTPQSNTLTLSDATINGSIVSNSGGDLIVKLLGTNTINNTAVAFQQNITTSPSPYLTFQVNYDGLLLTNANSIDELITGFQGPNIPDNYKIATDVNNKLCIAEYFGVKLYGQFGEGDSGFRYVTAANCNKLVTSNSNNEEIIYVSYDKYENKLTLNNLTEDIVRGGKIANGSSYFVESENEELNIHLVGENTFKLYSDNNGTYNVFFAKCTTINFTTDLTPGSLKITNENTYTTEVSPFEGEVTYSNCLGYSNENITGGSGKYHYVQLQGYGLTVKGIMVTEDNASHILGDNNTTVTFNASGNILTLNGADFVGNIQWASANTLTVKILGNNIIDAAYSPFFQGNSNANLILTTNSDNPGDLHLTRCYSNNVMSGWKNNNSVYYNKETSSGAATDYGWWAAAISDQTKLRLNKVYDLWVDNVQLCDAQNEVSFDPEDYSGNRITYEDGKLKFQTVSKTTENSPFIVNGLGDLTILLVGNNTLNCGALFLGKKEGDSDHNVTFETSGDSSGHLVITTTGGENAWYTGHNAPTYEGLALVDEMKNNVRTLTISEPISYNLKVAGVPVTSANATDVLGDGKVSYDSKTNKLTLNGATIAPQGEAPGIDYTGTDDLTISFSGTNSITGGSGCSAIRYNGTSQTPPKLTFESSSASSTLTLTETSSSVIRYFSSVLGVNGINDATGNSLALTNGDVRYDATNGLYTGDDQNTVPVTSATITSGYGLAVGGVLVHAGNALNVLSDQETPTVVFDESTNTLTLNGANLVEGSINYSGTEDLMIAIDGDSKLFSIKYVNDEVNDIPELTITKASGATDCSLALNSNGDGSVISGFSALNYGTFNTISSAPISYGKIDPAENYVCLFDAVTNVWMSDVTFTTATTYPIWVYKNGETTGTYVQITAENSTNVLDEQTDTKSVTYNDGTLTLNGATINSGSSYAFVMGDNMTALNVVLVGENTVAGNGFQFTSSSASLTFKTNGTAAGSLTIAEGDFVLASTGTTINYQNGLVYDATTKTVDAISAPTISSVLDGLTGERTVEIQGQSQGTVNYSLTYADSKLSANNVSNQEYSEAFKLLGPATIKATVTVNDVVSPEATAYYFGILPNPLTFVYDGQTAPTFTATLYPSVDDVSFTPTGSPDSFTTFLEGNVTITGFGRGMASANINAPETRNFTVLSDTIGFLMEVVPPAPTIAFDGTKTYLNSDKVTISLPTSLTGNQNATIKYSWDESCEPGSGYDYTDDGVSLNAGTNTLYAWVRYNGATSDDALYSERVSQAFTAKTDIDQFAVKDMIATDSTYTGSAIEPTFTLYDAKEPTNTLSAENYDVRIEKYSEAAGYTEVQSIVDAGKYKVYAVGKGDTYGGEKLIYEELVVNKANIQGLPTVAADDLVYDGTEQVLLPITVPDGVTVEYFFASITEEDYKGSYDPNCAGEVSYNTTIPKATNAGYFAIIYKVNGGNNYNNILPSGTIKVAILPAAITEVTLSENTKEYNGQAQTVTIESVKADNLVLSAEKGDYSVSYEKVEAQGTTPVDAPLEVGNYNVIVTGEGNFTGTKSAEFTVLKDPEFCFYVGEKISNGDTESYIYGEGQTLTELKRWDNGYLIDPTGFTITYTSSDQNVATIDNTGKITIKGVGLTEIRASIEATGEYAADEAWFIMKVVPAVPKVSIPDGAYFTGQELSITTDAQGGDLYYSYGYEEDESKRTPYDGKEILLPKGEYEFYPYTRCGTVDNPIWSYTEATELYVYDEPTISKNAGDYVGDIEVVITSLPQSDKVSVTAYYYLGDDEENAKLYTAGDKITVSESTKLNVYLLVEGDSGKKYKTKVIEREYTIKDIPLDVTAADFHNHWMTYYHNENGNVGLPEDQNIGAYVATSISGNEIVVTQIKSIPRGEPVLLNDATTTTTTNVFGQDVQGNLLVHATDVVDVAEKAGEGDFYGLYNGTFMRVTGTIPAGKNYLMVPNAVVPSGNAPQLTIVIDGEATGVNDVRSKMEDVRGDIYDLQGRKVQKPSKKGLYINKGHKVVVK